MSQQDTSVATAVAQNAGLDDTSQTGLDQTGSRLAVAGGILGALGVSSCCVLPLALTLLGVSGAWMANLRALVAYQPYFIGLAFLALGYGFYQVYWKPQQACTDGTACAKPLNNTLVKSGLWLGTIIALTSVTFSFWFPFIEPHLP